MPPKKDKSITCGYPGCTKLPTSEGLLYCGGHVLWPQGGKKTSARPPKKIRKK